MNGWDYYIRMNMRSTQMDFICNFSASCALQTTIGAAWTSINGGRLGKGQKWKENCVSSENTRMLGIFGRWGHQMFHLCINRASVLLGVHVTFESDFVCSAVQSAPFTIAPAYFTMPLETNSVLHMNSIAPSNRSEWRPCTYISDAVWNL